MRKFIKPQRNQLLMLQTVDLNSIALPGSALHSIDTIVDSLDTSAFEAAYDLESSRGNCPIAPKTIMRKSRKRGQRPIFFSILEQ